MERFHIPKLFFVVLFLLETSRFCLCKNTSFDCFERERQALLNLKKSFIKDPLHILSSWEGTDCCQWKGVSCSTSNGHVVKLDLHTDDFQTKFFNEQTYKNRLVAKDINPSLLELKYLIHLDLSGNDFQGSTIPEYFGLMKRLEYLDLSNANITGMVPHQLGNLTNLRELHINNHIHYYVRNNNGFRPYEEVQKLSIEDFNWISHLKSLWYVDMSGINLSGALNSMHVLNMLSSLRELRMSYCMLNDSHLARTFVNSTFLSTIQHLDLSHNSFSQHPLPIFLKNMTSLRVLDLSSNSFNSSIPLWLSNLKNLVHLDLANNQFNAVEGGLSMMLWNHCHLKSLNLSGNMLDKESLNTTRYGSGCIGHDLEELQLYFTRLTGHFPDWLGQFERLKFLDFSFNSFNGPIPASIGSLSNLRVLYLYYNQLSGVIPAAIGNLSALTDLVLSSNQLSGVIPATIGNLSALEHLHLSSNQLSGVIPATIGNLSALERLYLSSNQLSGVIPATIGNLSALTDLDLSFNQLSGVIPATIGSLSTLTDLDLSSNQLSGVIPATIGSLSALTDLDLSSNQLSGIIPATIGSLSALTDLDLSSNQLSGVIPATIGSLSALTDLDLSSNQLSGVIPATIGSLSALTYLFLYSNQLSGVIPETIGNLSALTGMYLSSNQLSGVIPATIGNLSALVLLDLSSNQLEGALSEIHFSNLSKLYSFHISFTHLSFNVKSEWVPLFQLGYIDMSSCKLRTPFPQWLETQKEVFELNLANASISGPLPNWLWSMHVDRLDLSKNRLTGPLPRFIGDTMPRIKYLFLSDNLINGTIPSSFSTIDTLKYLDLSHNRITGSIPRNISDMFPMLEYFYLTDNLINSTIPISFCKIDTLVSLDLSNNMVSGDIPNCWSGSNQLNALKLSSNELTGVIPYSIGHLIKLEWLHLKNNSLRGEVPLSLRNCRSLKLLNLAQNRFSGNIPTWIGESLLSLQILRLQKNLFNGDIPLQLCKLTTLKVLDLAVNNLSGTIPQCFGNFSGMVLQQTTKEYRSQYFQRQFDEIVLRGVNDTNFVEEVLILEVGMDLSNNNLIGMIPKGLTNLSGLIRLNLSHNHFIGSIPKSVGNLTSLEYLDFSTNQLSGNIPTSMSVLTSLHHLNLSYNNFSGKIPTGPQLQTLLDPSIYAGNHELCGAPLLTRCPGDEPPQAPIPDRHEENEEEDKSEKVWFYTFPVLGYITGLWGVLGVLLFKKSWRYAYFQLADNVIDWIYVRVAIKAAWLKKKMAKNHATN